MYSTPKILTSLDTTTVLADGWGGGGSGSSGGD